MVMLFSASTGQPEANYLVMQPMWCSLGLFACLIASSGDYRWLKRFSWMPWLLLAIAVALLVLVFVPGIRAKINGASRWIRYGKFSMQPSELAKIALIVALAFYGERYQRKMPGFFHGIVVPGVILSIVLGLIFLEPDVGTALLLAAVSAAMLLLAGIRWRYFLPPVLLAAVGLGPGRCPTKVCLCRSSAMAARTLSSCSPPSGCCSTSREMPVNRRGMLIQPWKPPDSPRLNYQMPKTSEKPLIALACGGTGGH